MRLFGKGRRTRSALVVVAALAMVAGLMVIPAEACSCMAYDPRDELVKSDAAIIGRITAVSPVDPNDQFADRTYTIAVEEPVKGDFGGTLSVRSAANGALCGIEGGPQQTSAWYLDQDEQGTYHTHLCHQIPPADMRAAADPLPTPTGTGPMKVLIGGSFGDQRLIAVNESGKVLGYGPGDGDVTDLAICPGSTYSVEAVDRRGEGGPRSFAVRTLSDLQIAWEYAIPLREDRYIADVYCSEADAGRVYVLLSDFGFPRKKSEMLELEGQGYGFAHEGTAHNADFFGKRAYLNEGKDGRKITTVHLYTHRTRTLNRLKGSVGKLTVSPDGKRLAVVVSRSNRQPRVVVLNARTGRRVNTFSLRRNVPGVLEWMSPRKIAFLAAIGPGKTSAAFTISGKLLGRFDGWSAEAATVVDGVAWGVDFTLVERAELPGGPTEYFGDLPSPISYAIVPVLDEVVLE